MGLLGVDRITRPILIHTGTVRDVAAGHLPARREAPAMEQLTFTTPAKRHEDQPVPVDWCGEHLTVRRPKDTVLYFASPIGDASSAGPDQAAAMFQFLDDTLEPDQNKRFYDRTLDRDDPINEATTIALIRGLLERWNDWPGDEHVTPLVIEPVEARIVGEPVNVHHSELDLDVVAHPPKDIVMDLVSSVIAKTTGPGQQAFAIGMFLDASLEAADAWDIARRRRDRADGLDLNHLSEIVADLLSHWAPRPANREQRRAAARA